MSTSREYFLIDITMNCDYGHMKYHVKPKLAWFGCFPTLLMPISSEGCQLPAKMEDLAGVPLDDSVARTGRMR